MNWRLLLAGLVSTGTLLSCEHVETLKPVPVEAQEICFQRQVLPIFTSYCSRVEGGCHDAGNPRVALVEYMGIMNGIQEGNADGSWFFHVIGRGMPPGAEPQLSADQLAVLRKWIEQGARNTNCEEVNCDSTHVRFAGDVDRIFADYCNGCHNSVVFPNSRSFSTLDMVRQAVRKNPERFLRSISYEPGPQVNMPPTFKMNDCDLHRLETWIHAGMPD